MDLKCVPTLFLVSSIVVSSTFYQITRKSCPCLPAKILPEYYTNNNNHTCSTETQQQQHTLHFALFPPLRESAQRKWKITPRRWSFESHSNACCARRKKKEEEESSETCTYFCIYILPEGVSLNQQKYYQPVPNPHHPSLPALSRVATRFLLNGIKRVTK
jgi:hypothetical protein